MNYTNKKNSKKNIHIGSEKHWSQVIAEELLDIFPNEDVYTCAAGITPSGVVHFGNFRDVMTVLPVVQRLKEAGKKVRFIFSWDDYDRLRKMPAGIDKSFGQYIGMPLTSIPDPAGEYCSYAGRFESEFEQSMRDLGITLDYRYQTKEYKAGRYDDLILYSLQNRLEIADILLSFMSEKGKREKSINPKKFKEDYYPISVYSRFTGKDNTRVLNYDGGTKITYRCLETDKTETIDLTKHRIAKLAWKIDWAMRWSIEGVVFEPGGHDHASPGGSYDVASVISRRIFKKEPPLFVGYQFIGIQGLCGKMSSSKGNVVSPADLLEIYEPHLLKWLYLRRSPRQAFSLAFDSTVYKEYDAFDSEITKLHNGQLNSVAETALKSALGDSHNNFSNNSIPFRQAVSYGQIVQWDPPKLISFLKRIGYDYDTRSVEIRLKKARIWLERYNPDQVIRLRDNINQEYVSKMDTTAIEHIRRFRKILAGRISKIEELERVMYSIPKDPSLPQKENSLKQRAFFKDVYNLLISKDTGPRLSTFLWALDRKQVLKLLDI